MCGICGIVDYEGMPVPAQELQRMMAAMKHRGPDDEGFYTDGALGFGHVRLSIIDLSPAGHQPMFSSDGRYVIVYNGEIYNYTELKVELRNFYEFRSSSDTEVILAAWQRWGKDCLHHLNGMFAFALYDKREKTVFIARDRFGIKPLYLMRRGSRLIFASDIPPLLTAGGKTEADLQSVYDFLVFNRVSYSDRTFFSGISRLLHGHYMYIHDGITEICRWYHPGNIDARPFESPDEYREMLSSAIRMQLRSDVPVGLCLSGGLDSSSITSLVLQDEDCAGIHTFSAVYRAGEKGDEREFIDAYRRQIRNMHFTTPDAAGLAEDLQNFVGAIVEPVPGTSEYTEYCVMRLAGENVKVLLNGQGADECLAGYLYFAGYYYRDLFRRMKWPSMISEMRMDLKHHQSYDGIRGFLFFSLPGLLKNRIAKKTTYWLDKDFAGNFNASDVITRKLYASKTLRQSFVDHFEHKFEHHLLWADRSGMHFSLEARFPFLDHVLVERTLATPPEKIIFKGWNKYILREAMKGILPEKIRMRRDKVGYESPAAIWFRTPALRGMVEEAVFSENLKNRGIIQVEQAQKMLDLHLAEKKDYSGQLWKILHLEHWFRRFID